MGFFRNLVSKAQQERGIGTLSVQAEAIVNMADNPKHLPKLQQQPDKVAELTQKLLKMSELQKARERRIQEVSAILDNQTQMYLDQMMASQQRTSETSAHRR